MYPTATDLSRHLRIMPELEAMSDGGYRPKEPRHRRLLHSLLMTAADLSDQTKRWLSSKKAAVRTGRRRQQHGERWGMGKRWGCGRDWVSGDGMGWDRDGTVVREWG